MEGAIRRGIIALVALSAIAGAVPAAASAATTTFYVATTGSDASNNCESPGAPCLTIAHAVSVSETSAGLGTIDLAPGTYVTTVSLTSIADFGLTIAGTGGTPGATVIQGPGGAGASTISFGAGFTLGSLTLSNVAVVNPVGNTRSAVSGGGALTLDGVTVLLADTTSSASAISDSLGPMTVANSTVTVDGTGDGIDASGSSLTMTSSSVTLADTSGSGDGVSLDQGTGSITGSTITTSATGGGVEATFAPLTIGATTFAVNGTGPAAVASASTMTLSGDAVSMNDISSTSIAVADDAGSLGVVGTTVGGVWHGGGVGVIGGGGTIVGSTISTSTLGNNDPAVEASGAAPSDALLVQRSSLSSRSSASPGTLVVGDEDLVTDSTLIQGGDAGVSYAESGGKSNTATIDSTTIDAGVAGTGAQSGVSSIDVTAGTGRNAAVAVNGSILVQAPVATVSGGGTASVVCADSDVPNAAQPASATLGSISCATSASGNTSSPLASLFVSPGINDQLLPTSAAVDSVPEAAVALPDGFTSATTDLPGSPRVVDGNGDCAAIRDRGAFELQGHAGTIPAPAISAPPTAVTGVAATFAATVPNDPAATLTWQFSDGVTATGASVTHAFAAPGTATATLTAVGSPASCAASAAVSIAVVAPPALTPPSLSPAKFRPAPSGGAIAKRRVHGTGTVIAYTATEAGTTTFTVLTTGGGRKVGGVCEKPRRNNRHEPRCTLRKTIGRFTHADAAGVNTFVFTGRVDGKPLRAGSYQLKGVPSNANGAGTPVVKTFTIS